MSTLKRRAGLELERHESNERASTNIQTYLNEWQSQGRSITALLHHLNAQHQEHFFGTVIPGTAPNDTVPSQPSVPPTRKDEKCVGMVHSGGNALEYSSNSTIIPDGSATRAVAADFWSLWPFDFVQSAQPSMTVSGCSGPCSNFRSCSPVTAAEYSTCYSDGPTECLA